MFAHFDADETQLCICTTIYFTTWSILHWFNTSRNIFTGFDGLYWTKIQNKKRVKLEKELVLLEQKCQIIIDSTYMSLIAISRMRHFPSIVLNLSKISLFYSSSMVQGIIKSAAKNNSVFTVNQIQDLRATKELWSFSVAGQSKYYNILNTRKIQT